MENSNRYNSGNLKKCPYQCQIYGTDKAELVYRKTYQGDWGDWDDPIEKNIKDENKSDLVQNQHIDLRGAS